MKQWIVCHVYQLRSASKVNAYQFAEQESVSKVNDLYWGLQKCACDSNTTCGLVITLMNY